MRGRPRGCDFHFRNSRKPCRCQRIKVSGLTMVRACQGKSLESITSVNLAAALGRRGWTWRSRYSANCLRRKRFSAARTHPGRRQSRMNLKASSSRSKMVGSRLERRSNVGIHDRIAHLEDRRHGSRKSRRTKLLRTTGLPLDVV